MNTSDEARARIPHTGRLPDVPPSNPFEGTGPHHTAEVRVLFVYTDPADPRLVSGVVLDLHVKTKPNGNEWAAVLLRLEGRGPASRNRRVGTAIDLGVSTSPPLPGEAAVLRAILAALGRSEVGFDDPTALHEALDSGALTVELECRQGLPVITRFRRLLS